MPRCCKMFSRMISYRLAPFVRRQSFSKLCIPKESHNLRASFSISGRRHALLCCQLTDMARACRGFSEFPLKDSSTEKSETTSPREKSIEEQYSRKNPREHVLLRPGMYVGPVDRLPPMQCWVLDPLPEPYDFSKESSSLSEVSPEQTTTSTAPSSFRMTSKEYGLVPALIKIFDEILVNASDNRLRNPKTCTTLDVRIDPGSSNREPRIRIFNDGKGIPIQIHAEEKMYLPEMLFGNLLTGSNFDDEEKRLTGGRHGFGAKLTNIFSKSFTIETIDSKKRQRYEQTWLDNMTKSSPPKITKIQKGTKDYTCITFVPDMQRLGGDSSHVQSIDPQDYAIMCRRVVDAAGCAAGKLKVFLNGMDVSLDSFADYSNMYLGEGSKHARFSILNERWTVGVGLSDGHSFESVSFVNGMATPRGGTHVNSITSQIVKRIQKKALQLEPDLAETLTAGLIRRNLFVSCNALIENPSFDSQMKEYLTSNPSSFGSSCELSKTFLKQLTESKKDGGPGIVEEVIRVAKGREHSRLLKKVGGTKTKRELLGIPKLEDAHEAGKKNRLECSLILTEGDSAKALAVAGLEVIGRDHYGVFPLRGKFLNVRHATVDQLAKNAEVKALVSILGLDFGKEYDTASERAELRYDHVMLMTDQDTDGSHIKGLVINFFRHFWPQILKPAVDDPVGKTFLSFFVTPLLKARHKKDELSFYSMADYKRWRASIDNPGELKQWKIKYYKGLGTSTPAEAKDYFSEFEKHHRPFLWHSERDGETLDKVFDKARAADRREWLSNEYDAEATLDFGPNHEQSVGFEDFVNKEMIHFSIADNIRSLPSAIDGLKPSQRKVLYACFKRKLTSEMKVAQLSGYCAEHTAYHHGEVSLQKTIVTMAQDFVGSNNLNLLVPSGTFGSRQTGGDNAASPRYIFTHLSPATRHLFPEDDDILLEYLEDDGQLIEPKYYCPIIPLLLVNGSQGIGSGWSTFIPPHNPMSVLDYIRRKLEGQVQLPSIEPYVRGFTGKLERLQDGTGYVSHGKIKILNSTTVQIDELPVGMWTDVYKSRLLKMQAKGDVTHFKEYHKDKEICFKVTLTSSQLELIKGKLEKTFRLTSNLLLTNMNAFNENGQIEKFQSAEAIAESYFPIRLSVYHHRKSVLEAHMEYLASKQRNKARFIQMVSDKKINLTGGKVSRDDARRILKEKGFSTTTELESIMKSNSLAKGGDGFDQVEENAEDSISEEKSDFDYLLTMPLLSLTSEKISSLHKEAEKIDEELRIARATQPEELWMSDLEKLAKYL